MVRRQFFGMLGLFSAIGFVVSGCGGGGVKEVKVTGSVIMGGKAQEGVRIGFVPSDPKKASSKGTTTDAEGKFELKVQPGSYKVVLTKYVDRKGNVPKESDNPTEDITQLEASGYLRQVIPPQYTEPEQSPIKVDIPPEGKNLEPFTVTK